jgi:secondary thiamine-phosphate synthase enzyme
MSDPAPAWTWPSSNLLVDVRAIAIRTDRPVQMVDLTAQVAACVRDAGLWAGLASVQVLHTTAGLLLNEKEPLLFEDLEGMFERVAPRGAPYRHDQMELRVPAPPPDERRNGHAHCRAALLQASLTVHVRTGLLVLGRWQRLLMAELDGPQTRSVSVALLGSAQPDGAPSGGW